MEETQVQLQEIQKRNIRVEADKAWETSMFRKLLIALITYVIASAALYVIGVPDFYLGAIIPTLGFLLSTLTLQIVKKWWIQNRYTKASQSVDHP